MRPTGFILRLRSRRRGDLLRDDSGATAVEFAFVAVPFFGLVLLILQIGLFHFSLQSLDFAVRQAGRTVMTGQVSGKIAAGGDFKTTYVCPNVFWGIDCNKLIINSFKLGKTSSIKDSSGIYAYIDTKTRELKSPIQDATQQSFCLGGPGDYVYLDLAYPYPNYVARLLSFDAKTTMMMRSSTVVYNEPFKNSSGGASC